MKFTKRVTNQSMKMAPAAPASFAIFPRNLIVQAALAAVVTTFSAGALAQVDEDAVKKLLKRNDCTKCHAVDKTKKGPSYKKVAEKFRSKKGEAEKLFMDNLTKKPKVKLEDGTEEEHKEIDTKDPKELKNLFNWILSL